jgi:hypothetical protein
MRRDMKGAGIARKSSPGAALKTAVRLLSNQNGSAVLEVALVAVVILLSTMWSHVFFDVIQVRMKVLEEARSAVFEFTAYDLSDYTASNNNGQGHQKRLDDAIDVVKKDIDNLYGEDLDSSYNYKKNKIALQRWSLDQLTIEKVDVKQETSLDQSIWGLLNWFNGITVPGVKSFNQRGFVKATARASFTSRFAPGYRKTDISFGQEIKRSWFGAAMTESLYMLVDSWKLEDGCNVQPDGTYMAANASTTCAAKTGQSQLWLEVNRLITPAQSISIPGTYPNPFQVRTASVGFKADGADQGALVADPTKEGLDGKVYQTVSQGESSFYTAPFCTSGSMGGGACTGAYATAYNARGNFFMGCPKAQADKKGTCEYNQVTPVTP